MKIYDFKFSSKNEIMKLICTKKKCKYRKKLTSWKSEIQNTELKKLHFQWVIYKNEAEKMQKEYTEKEKNRIRLVGSLNIVVPNVSY